MKIGSPSPIRVDEAPRPRPTEGGEDTRPAAPRRGGEADAGPDSLLDVRLIGAPSAAEARKPVRTPEEAEVVAGEAAAALKAAPEQAAQVAGKVRPESAAAVGAPPDARTLALDAARRGPAGLA